MCSVDVNDFLCACPKGYSGESCSIVLEDVDKTKVLPPFIIDKYKPKCNNPMGYCSNITDFTPEWVVKANAMCDIAPETCQLDMGVTGSLITGVEAPAGHLIKQKAGTSAYYQMKLANTTTSGLCKEATLVNAEVEGATGQTTIKYTSTCILSDGAIDIIIAVYAEEDVVYKGIKVQIAMANGTNFSAPGTAKVSPKADKSSVYDGVDLIKGEFIIFKK